MLANLASPLVLPSGVETLEFFEGFPSSAAIFWRETLASFIVHSAGLSVYKEERVFPRDNCKSWRRTCNRLVRRDVSLNLRNLGKGEVYRWTRKSIVEDFGAVVPSRNPTCLGGTRRSLPKRLCRISFSMQPRYEERERERERGGGRCTSTRRKRERRVHACAKLAAG